MFRRTISLLTALMIVLWAVCPALAGGGAGPPKNFRKGEFLSVDEASGTAVFRPSGSEETITVYLGKLKPEEVELKRKVMVTFQRQHGRQVIKSISVMFMDMTLKKILALVIIGLVGGMLSGFIGSGGAFVLTPSMMSLGAPGAVAVASNMCHKFPKAMVGAYKRYKYGQADVKLGLVMATSAIVGVQIGIKVQKFILQKWGNAGSNLYVSLAFVVILVIVGGYVFWDAWRLAKGGAEVKTTKLALALQRIKIPPMMEFKRAGVRLSAWVTIPVGLATGMLAATIAVGGFIGGPGMIYVLGASALVASATELVIAFVMGLWGSIQWGLSGLIDIRLTLLILAGSLFGVQLGALGTTYVKDYMIKVVMGAVMLIVAVSRGAKVPIYLEDLGAISPLAASTKALLNQVSFWALVTALGTAGVIITAAMVKGMLKARAERKEMLRKGAVSHG